MQDRSIAAVYVTFPTLSAAVRAVGSEETDAVITPYEWARNAENAELTRNLHMVTNEALVSTYRMGVTKARPGLVAELEEVLQQVVQTPEYEALREKWFSQYDSPRATESTSGTGPDRNLIPLIVAVIVAGIVLFVLTDRRANRL
jgi:ABC-type amino acid transport substrate-binding protein